MIELARSTEIFLGALAVSAGTTYFADQRIAVSKKAQREFAEIYGVIKKEVQKNGVEDFVRANVSLDRYVGELSAYTMLGLASALISTSALFTGFIFPDVHISRAWAAVLFVAAYLPVLLVWRIETIKAGLEEAFIEQKTFAVDHPEAFRAAMSAQELLKSSQGRLEELNRTVAEHRQQLKRDRLINMLQTIKKGPAGLGWNILSWPRKRAARQRADALLDAMRRRKLTTAPEGEAE